MINLPIKKTKLTSYEKFMYFIFNTIEQKTPTNVGVYYNIYITIVLFFHVLLLLIKSESALDQYQQLDMVLLALEFLCTLLMLIDLLLRIWSSYSSPTYKYVYPYFKRLRYLFSFWVLFDIVAMTVQFYYLTIIVSTLIIKRANILIFEVMIYLRLLRILRLLRAQKSLNGIHMVWKVLKNKWRELIVSTMLLLTVFLTFSALMFAIEKSIQPETMGSIPRVLYFTVITFVTIGYGDITPKTWTGRAFVSITAILPISIFGIPISIFASGILDELENQNANKPNMNKLNQLKLRDYFTTWKRKVNQKKIQDKEKKDKEEKEKKKEQTLETPINVNISSEIENILKEMNEIRKYEEKCPKCHFNFKL